MILSTAQIALGVALLLAAPIFWTLINAEDTRGQKMGPHPIGLVTVLIAVLGVVMVNVYETVHGRPIQFVEPTAPVFVNPISHPQAAVEGFASVVWLLAAVSYFSTVHKWGESTDE